MNDWRRCVVLGFLAFCTVLPVQAKSVEVPLQISYPFIRKVLVDELFTEPGQTAKVWGDKHGCAYLNLAEPQVGHQDGLLRLVSKMQTRLGARLAGKCIPLLRWEGFLETLQKPTLDAAKTVVTFPIVDMKAYDPSGKPLGNDELWENVRHYVEPKLSKVKLDIAGAKQKILKTLPEVIDRQKQKTAYQAVESLRLDNIVADQAGVDLAFAFDLPDSHKPRPAAAAVVPFSAEEMQVWESNWQLWEAFLDEAIAQASKDTASQALRKDLQVILMDARSTFKAALANPVDEQNDPVRGFFKKTWPRLAASLKKVALTLPSKQSLRYMAFITATDVLYELDKQKILRGVDISANGLRKLGRLLINEKAAQKAAAAH